MFAIVRKPAWNDVFPRLRAAGFTYAEIGEAMGVQSGTVSAFVTRSREKARPILNPQPWGAGRSPAK